MAQSVYAHVVLILVTKVVQFPLVQHWVRITAFSSLPLGVRLRMLEGLFVFSSLGTNPILDLLFIFLDLQNLFFSLGKEI